MSILSKIYAFIHYVSMPLRLVLYMLVICSIVYFVVNSNDPLAIQFYYTMGSKIMAALLSLNVNVSQEDIQKYLQYLYSDKKFICVFNHSTLIDGHVLSGIFSHAGFLLIKWFIYDMVGQNDNFNKKTGCMWVKKGETTKQIIEHVENRKYGGHVLFIAPGAGNVPAVPGNITEFCGKGAFVGKYPILPILLKFEDDSLNHNFDNGESLIHSCLKLFLVYNYKINVKVGDMIEPSDDETVEEYRDRVYNIMNDIYHNMSVI